MTPVWPYLNLHVKTFLHGFTFPSSSPSSWLQPLPVPTVLSTNTGVPQGCWVVTPWGGEGLSMLPGVKGLRCLLQPSEPRQLQKHIQCPNAGAKSFFGCWAMVAAPSSGAGCLRGVRQPVWWGGEDTEWFSLPPAAAASCRAAQLENQAESQEILSYIPDADINFIYGLGQLISPASLGFSLDKVGKIVNIMDL